MAGGGLGEAGEGVPGPGAWKDNCGQWRSVTVADLGGGAMAHAIPFFWTNQVL